MSIPNIRFLLVFALLLTDKSGKDSKTDLTTTWTFEIILDSGCNMDAKITIDATGLLCPLPVLKLAKAMRALNSGDIACLRATDPAAVVDVPHFCSEQGHVLLASNETGAETHYFVEKS